MVEAVPSDVRITADLVRALLKDQHPDLAELPIELIDSGWDHVMARLGRDLCVRLPRRALGAGMIGNEQSFLAAYGAELPLPVPVPLRTGEPTTAYPYRWSVVPWLPGLPATVAPPTDQHQTAAMLGRFLGALHRPAPADAPHNPYRGVPLADRVSQSTGDGSLGTIEERLARACPELHLDRGSLEHVVDQALAAPRWSGRPVWCHGDLHPRNLLVDDGVINAVIDFSDVCGGDPAVDAIVAWLLLDPEVHGVLRHQTHSMDDHTWARGMGWAVHLSLTIYLGSDDPAFRATAAEALRRLSSSGALLTHGG
ncbi:aminoglycoside phosphotransferase family protein [Euzebya tangerina]|uniref:aminoglycoside phosphotransferase family protein n=1 Tax=Euzebya tangerina TaxID=591198 RepID=UPI000E3105BF|nr:aminoglycoside phosphotransferase family protein [Euzebya tangerina]